MRDPYDSYDSMTLTFELKLNGLLTSVSFVPDTSHNKSASVSKSVSKVSYVVSVKCRT